MSVLKILTWPSKILETKAEKVITFDDNLKQFVSDMHETMKKADGIGLAANQVGSLKRIITICIPRHKDEKEETWHNKRLTFINPTLRSHSNDVFSSQEGCLSLPGVYEFIDRYGSVIIEALDENGKNFTMEATDLLAVCIQHEIDHLDGITFLKRMSRLKSSLARKKLMKNKQGSYIP